MNTYGLKFKSKLATDLGLMFQNILGCTRIQMTPNRTKNVKSNSSMMIKLNLESLNSD